MPRQSKSATVRQAKEARIRALAEDDRLFRAELVSSVLKIFNAVYLTEPLGRVNPGASAQPLAWVREVNARRAVIGAFPREDRTVWAPDSDPGNAIQPRPLGETPAPIQRLAQFFQRIVPDHKEYRLVGLITVKITIDELRHAQDPEVVAIRDRRIKWLNQVLESTNIWTKLRFKDGEIREVSLIQLNTIERCVAYAIAWLIQNKDGLFDRIRVCPFTGRDMANPHYWLDFRLESDGKMARGTEQIYCCTRHAVAARAQRRRGDRK